MEQVPNGSLAGRVAIVTGGASGIGRATSLHLAEAGAAVVVADLRSMPREGGEPTEELIAAAGGSARFVECDVTDADDHAKVVAAARELGGVGILVNCAGIFRAGGLLEIDQVAYRSMMDVNVGGTIFMSKAAVPAMIEGGGGAIVNLSSVGGIQGSGGFCLYQAAKGAVRLFTYSLADELGPQGIRVNALHPGMIATSMTRTDVPVIGTPIGDAYEESLPLRRAGTPDDVARAAVFLASDQAEYITGSSLNVDGGMVRV
jgi:NAD(P)-dependent dehydrogenase (short-subunit alcohol dehydrogenase family)